MCPIWPLHLIILYLLALGPLWVLCQTAPNIIATFSPEQVEIHMEEYYDVNVTITGFNAIDFAPDNVIFVPDRSHISTLEQNNFTIYPEDLARNAWSGTIRVLGNFLGRTHFNLTISNAVDSFTLLESLDVIITRPQRVIDTVFTSSVATFVSLIFINFGCAMHWPTVREVIKKPIGPLIGMLGQFLFMPLMSFGLGFLVFPDNGEMRLGMFFTGVSPGGGASNIWTFILGGNLNLSLAMTTISTLASFAFMPLWLFSLGQVVFRSANIGIPYARIASFVVGLIIPLGIGLAMQRFTPRLAAFMVRILKGFSTILLLFIIVFAIVTNLYIFELFTWQIIVAGLGLPWLGFLAGYLLTRIFRQPHTDAIAVSMETGVQNTGIAIFLLRYALDQPEADLTTVVPVAVAIMTPIPMTIWYIVQKIMGCINKTDHTKILDEDNVPISESPERKVSVIATIDAEQRTA